MQGGVRRTLWFCVPEIGERIIAGDSRKDIERTKGPYIKDVRKISGILDPLPPPCPHFG